MALSRNEEVLTAQNLSQVSDFFRFLQQNREVLLGESGFREETEDVGLESFLQEQIPDLIPEGRDLSDPVKLSLTLQERIRDGKEAGLSDAEVAKELGLDPTTFQKIRGTIDKANQAFSEMKRLEEKLQIKRNTGVGVSEEEEQRLLNEIEEKRKESRQITQRLQDITIEESELVKTEERKELEKRIKGIQDQSLDIFQQRLKTAQEASRGEREPSEKLKRSLDEEFKQFKETMAKRGVDIQGDDPFTATAQDTAGNQALQRFQNLAKDAIFRENQAVIQTGLAQSQPFVGGARQFSRQTPAFPNIAGFSQLAIASQAPLRQSRQFDQNLALRRDILNFKKSQAPTDFEQIGGALLSAGSMLGAGYLSGGI